MVNHGPIIIIDDDTDDLEFYEQVFRILAIPNKVLTFECADEALDYLKSRIDPCFFILCDINMPRKNGLELRAELVKEPMLKYKSIPFLFLTTSDQMETRAVAFKQAIQGYFKKPDGMDDVKSLFTNIVSYWSDCLPPPSPSEMLAADKRS